MRADEILFESSIQDYSETFKSILRTSYKQATKECNDWDQLVKNSPDALHPIEKRSGVRIKALHDFK